MLNLSPIFEHALRSLTEFGSFLTIPPLPSTVFLLQRDVVNHYHHALTHYMTLNLTEPFLQNSSLGTPYQKWQKFTNDDFAELSFCITQLVRSTSRLVRETTHEGMLQQKRGREIKQLPEDDYIEFLYAMKNGQVIGIQIQEEKQATIQLTPYSCTPSAQSLKIGNRNVLNELAEQGLLEIQRLQDYNKSFGKICDVMTSGQSPHTEFKSLNQSWWMI